jgi:hypothetical protein
MKPFHLSLSGRIRVQLTLHIQIPTDYAYLRFTMESCKVKLFRVSKPKDFDNAQEHCMDAHLATDGKHDGFQNYIVVGSRVAFQLGRFEGAINEKYLNQPWLHTAMDQQERSSLFERWLENLPEAQLYPTKQSEFMESFLSSNNRPNNELTLAYIVRALGPLGAPPLRPASIYGHLPFGAMTDAQSVIYRWEAFPTSRRIKQISSGGTIASDTYAAPASEVPFAPTGFSAVARFALPNLLPACFRWELQPVPCSLECGASVPLYGQSGGGVEVKFTASTNNRGPIANPIVLSPM